MISAIKDFTESEKNTNETALAAQKVMQMKQKVSIRAYFFTVSMQRSHKWSRKYKKLQIKNESEPL